MRYDGVDWSEWQDPDPAWGSMSDHIMVCCRLCDGTHYDSRFADSWQAIQDLPARYKGFYVLPDPRLGAQQQFDYVASYYDRAGVPFGAPGHFISIDDEPTTIHGQFGGQAMRDLRSLLLAHFGRPDELHYVGAYNDNCGFCIDEGWPWWVPWPTSNGPLPSWTADITGWQWGVAGPGEVSGFGQASVDVNMVLRTDVFDVVAGLAGVQPKRPKDDDMLMRDNTNGRVFVVGVEGKRQVSTGDELAAWQQAGQAFVDVSPSVLSRIPDQLRTIARSPSTGAIYTVGARGKRYMHPDEYGWQSPYTDSDVWDTAAVDKIPDVPSGPPEGTITFAANPDNGQVWLVWGTAWRRYIGSPDGLSRLQAHWAARGADVNVYNWTPADLEAIPRADALDVDVEKMSADVAVAVADRIRDIVYPTPEQIADAVLAELVVALGAHGAGGT